MISDPADALMASMTTHHGDRSMFENSSLINRTARPLTLAIALASLAGCSSTQTTSGTDDAQATPDAAVSGDEWSIDHGAWDELGYEWLWTGYPPLARGAVIDHAIAYEDLLTFMGSGSTMSVLEANTGKVRWSRQIDRPTTRFVDPVLRDGILYTASDTELWEIDAKNGNTLDRDSLGSLVNTSPLLVDNLAIFGTLSGELFAHQMENDFKLWSYKFDGPINVAPIDLGEGMIAALSEKGELRALDASNAHTSMTTRIAGGSDANILTDSFGIYIASLDQSLYAFDIADGYRFWRIRSSAPVTVQHTLHEGVLYATTRDGGLMAIDSASGDVIWSNPEIGGWVLTINNASELMVYSGYEMLAVDMNRGDIIARAPISGVSGIRTDSQTDGNIYVITLDGSVAKFGRR